MTNLGRVDRSIRFILGVLVLGLYGALDAPWRYFTLLGLVLIATALSGYCPLYGLLDLNTASRSDGGTRR